MKIDMQMKIMEQVEENMKLMNKQFNDEGNQIKKKEEEINNIVKKQDSNLNERLAKRKKKLRKKSADLKQKQMVEVEEPPPIPKEQLIQLKNIIRQTYERFTRLTMNKSKRGTQSRNVEN